MKFLSALAIIFSCIVMSTNARADNYGAIAYDLGTNGYGVTWDQRSQQAANQIALNQCATVGGNCNVVVQFANSCGAFSTGRNGASGHGFGATRSVAENAATYFCNQQGTGCKTRVWGCNTTYGSQTFESGKPVVDPDAAARNRSYAESAKSWGGQQEYDRICSNSPGGC